MGIVSYLVTWVGSIPTITPTFTRKGFLTMNRICARGRENNMSTGWEVWFHEYFTIRGRKFIFSNKT